MCTPTPTTAGRCSPWPRRQGELARGLVAGARGRGGGGGPGARTAGLHPHVGRAGRDAGGLPGRGPPRCGVRGGAHRRGADRRRAGRARLPLRRAGHRPRPRRARGPAPRRPGGAGRADGGAASCAPDFGPPRVHPTAGALLAAARPPLVAFNVDLATDDLELARAVAADIRESGARRAGRRARDRADARRPRARAGLHQRARPPRHAARGGGRGGAGTGAGGRGRAGGPGARGRLRRASPRTCPCAASTPLGT